MSDVPNYNIEDASGANVRIDLNAVFGAIQSSNSKGSDLAVTQRVPGMWFLRSDTNTLNIIDSSSGITTVGNINSANLGLLPRSGGTSAPMTGQFLADDSNSATAPAISFATNEKLGLFRTGVDQMGFACADAEQMIFDANGITLNLANAIRFSDNDSSNYVALKAPATVGTNYTLTLPTATGSAGEFLKIESGGQLSFGTVTSTQALTVNGNLTVTGNAGTLKVSTLQDASGNNPSTPEQIAQGRAKAWVHFDGTFGTSPFTVANGGIYDSYNVSSVTDSGTGKYIVNMSITMPNINYAVVSDGRFDTNDGLGTNHITTRRTAFTTTTFGIRSSTGSTSQANDSEFVCAVVFGD